MDTLDARYSVYVFQVVMVAWIVLVVLCIRRTAWSPDGSVGIPAAFLLAMTFMYGGAFVYAVPGYTHTRTAAAGYLIGYAFTESTILQGLVCSLLAVAGFVLGTGAFK